MDIIKVSERFINTLYFKTKNNIQLGFSSKIIGEIAGLNRLGLQNVLNYLFEKNWIAESEIIGGNVKLTAEGLELVAKFREKKRFKTIRFHNYHHIPTNRDATEVLFNYEIIDENGQSEWKKIKVGISGHLSINWGFPIWNAESNDTFHKLARILFQYAKKQIVQKLKEGTLDDYEELMLLTTTHPDKLPFNADKLVRPEGTEYEIETGSTSMSDEIKKNKLAAAIIEIRDRINAIFNYKHGTKLLLLDEERNLLDFFKTAETEEEFSHRLASLGQVARNLNVTILRNLSGESDTKIGSVALLEKFLNAINIPDKSITDTLRQIGRIRQGYPVHRDIPDVVKGYKYFDLEYPVTDFEGTWTLLLQYYLNALKKLYAALAQA